MFKSDYHFHTALSFDGKDDLLDVIQVAAEKGMNDICVTNHYECGGEYPCTNQPISVMRDNYLKAVAQNRTQVRAFRRGTGRTYSQSRHGRNCIGRRKV